MYIDLIQHDNIRFIVAPVNHLPNSWVLREVELIYSVRILTRWKNECMLTVSHQKHHLSCFQNCDSQHTPLKILQYLLILEIYIPKTTTFDCWGKQLVK